MEMVHRRFPGFNLFRVRDRSVCARKTMAFAATPPLECRWSHHRKHAMANPDPQNWLEAALARTSRARVAVFGDFCLDAYWELAPDESERSVETGLPVRRVRRQRYSLGGAGNVAANLAALGVAELRVVGVVGADLFGCRLLELLRSLPANIAGMLADQPDWQTPVYAKPCTEGHEANRIDFGTFNQLAAASLDTLATRLDEAAAGVDVVVLNQQLPGGVATAAMIARLNAVIARHPRCLFLVDARHRADAFSGAILKLNAHEAASLLGGPQPADATIPASEAAALAQRLSARTGRPVFVTRGADGIAAADGAVLHEIPGIQTDGRIDTVGAGDTVVAALAAALGAGCSAAEAARLANLAASITVRKLQTTGTATPAEIRAVGPEPDYVHAPELAEAPHRARLHPGTEIEIVNPLPAGVRIRHALFDHDGTLGTLREGWEAVMEPMMLRAILGPRHATADAALRAAVTDEVRRFIDRTTGIQTLAQMAGLAGLVRQFGCMPEAEILDPHGYKALYNEELLQVVRTRLARLQRGELAPGDFQIAGAADMLRRLHAAGVKLYLASGTDHADVVTEAQAMGYAELFEGRIYGAVGDVRIEAKREVLQRILREHRVRGTELAVFGDGPVEIREAHRAGGIAVGVASDEVRRAGLNPHKRRRLVRAGADLIVPDFRHGAALLALLGIA
jgi:rfaE bifunctional protein kinase chain/domain